MLAVVSGSSFAGAEEDPRQLYLEATPVLDVRYRFEFVDQDGLPKNAQANTVRTRAGYETGRFHGIGAGFDFEWVEAIGGETFNNTVNGKTRFPVVADPNDAALNQLFLVLDGTVPDTRLKAGRQRVIWDNQRFVGNVGFRQNEQTFDAVRASTTMLQHTEIEYNYFGTVHRVFGEDSPVGRFAMNTHGARIKYDGLGFVSVVPFALLLDYDRLTQAGNSSASAGVLFSGNRDLDDDWTAHYAGGFAHQQDFGENPGDFELWYYAIEPGISYDWLRTSLGYEVLQGNGLQAFQTPLATLHKFNGFTDQFLTTPPDGLQDLYVRLDLRVPGKDWYAGIAVKGGYHVFGAENGGAHYGSEWDIGAFKTIGTEYGSLSMGLQYADYNADTFSRDTKKLWFTLQFKLAPKPYRDFVSRL